MSRLVYLGCLASLALACGPSDAPANKRSAPPSPQPEVEAKTEAPAVPTPDTEPDDQTAPECESIAACTDQCTTGDAEACERGVRLHEAQWTFDLKASADLLEKACERKDADSCSALAVRYQDGRGRPHDDASAAELYAEACEAGSGVGCFNLGLMHQGGNGAELDPARAKELFAKALPHYQAACDAGEHEWCMNLGFLYEHGYLGQPDPQRAADVYDAACKAGHDGCCANQALAWLSAGQRRDEALRSLETWCTKDSALACGILGHVYLKPDPAVQRDATRAAELTKRGCELGDARSCTLHAGLHALGDDLPLNMDRADTFYRRGCDLGSSDACFLASLRFAREAPSQAVPLLERACNIGHGEGCGQLGAHYELGLGVTANPERAQQLYVESCRLGHPGSCVALIKKGVALPLPPDLSQRMRAGACANGVAEACTAAPTR